jgi:hypothetical protein
MRPLLDPVFRAIRHVWRQYGTLITIGLGVLTIALGCMGFARLSALQGTSQSLYDDLYMTLKLFPLNGDNSVPIDIWEVQLARFLAPVFSILTLLQFVSALFSESILQLRLRLVRDHVIVCGKNPMGLALVQNFLALGWPVAVIDPAPESKEMDTARELGAFIVNGDPVALAAQKIARVDRARYLFAVTDNDSLNAEIATTSAGHVEAVGRGRAFLTCFVHIVDGELCSLLQEQELGAANNHYALELFNVFQIAGQQLSRDCPPFQIQPAPPDCSLLILSPGPMGESLVYNVVKRWREAYADAKKLRITLLDREATAIAGTLRRRYPALDRYCNLVALDADPQATSFDYDDVLFEDGRVTVTQVYICTEDQSAGLAAALRINRCLVDYGGKHGVQKPAVPIVLRTTGDGISRLFGSMSRKAGSFDNICAFQLIERACNVEYLAGGLNETIARAIHEDYLRLQRANGVGPGTNPSVIGWEYLPETLKLSNRNQAVHIHEKIRTIGCEIARAAGWEEVTFAFTVAEVEMLAHKEHDRFVEERVRQGWRYGPAKDVEKKISPYLVPYESLTEAVKDLDRNAVRALPAILGQADLKIVRLPRAPGSRENAPVPKIAT